MQTRQPLRRLAIAALGLIALSTAAIAPQSKSAIGEWGFDVSTISRTVRPGDDFYAYANEGWLKSSQIPPGHWDYGQFDVVGDEVNRRLRSLVEGIAKDQFPKRTPKQQIADAHSAFMNTGAIGNLGIDRIKPELNRIFASRSLDDVAKLMADPTSSSIVAINVYPEAGRWLVHLDQQNIDLPMLGLPRREYYDSTEGAFPSNRKAYTEYIAKLFDAVGVDNIHGRAQDVLSLETKIADLQWGLEKLRDRKLNYHPMSVDDLVSYAPGFPWRVFLTARGVGDEKEVVLGTDTAVKAQAILFAETPVDVWNSYLAFHWIQNQVDCLPEFFRSESFKFNGQTLNNAKTDTPRDAAAFQFVNGHLAQLVGQLYIQQFFPKESKDSAEELFGYLRRAFADRLSKVDWMDAPTQKEAKAKLAAFRFKVAYPEVWRDYSNLEIRRDDAAGNAERIRQADWAYKAARLHSKNHGLPWFESPQTVDASYSVLMNAIELPAAMLQPPFFDPNADPAVNFGAIGATIGHEMGHGFDDQGAIFDGKGRMRNWWSATASNQFHQRTQALVDQYDAFTPVEGLHLNGALTLGENIGDLTGVSLAYRAYHLYLDDHLHGTAPILDGLTGDQRFFLAWAQNWRVLTPESAMRFIVANSYHSPAIYRVNGVVRNIDAWYKAFGVTQTGKLYLPEDKRVHLW